MRQEWQMFWLGFNLMTVIATITVLAVPCAITKTDLHRFCLAKQIKPEECVLPEEGR